MLIARDVFKVRLVEFIVIDNGVPVSANKFASLLFGAISIFIDERPTSDHWWWWLLGISFTINLSVILKFLTDRFPWFLRDD